LTPQPIRWIWIAVTFPVFLLLVPVATAVSIFDHRDVFPAAHYWTHALFFGHRWIVFRDVPEAYNWETCDFCGVMRVKSKLEEKGG